VCIGAPLARIELEASLEALRTFWPDFQLAEEPSRTGAFVIWGLEAVQLARN
jgi:unspecific monooxygenase